MRLDVKGIGASVKKGTTRKGQSLVFSLAAVSEASMNVIAP